MTGRGLLAGPRVARCLVAVIVVTVACKQEDRKPAPASVSSTGSAPHAEAPLGVSDTEIVLGEPAAFSGPSAGLGIEQWRGAAAAFRERNEAGGVGGRKLRLVLADDGYEAERAAPAVVKLVNEGHVFVLFATVGTPTIVKALPVVKQYFAKDGLFLFANFSGAQPQRNPPYSEAVFNVRASYREEVKAIVDAYVAAGRKKIGVFAQDDAYGTDGREGVKRALDAHGLELVADVRYPRGQKFEVSNDAQLKILKDSGADAIVMVGSYQACAGMVRDIRASGWSVPIHNVSFVGANQMLALLSAEQKRTGKAIVANLINTQVVPFYDDTSVPLVKQYRAAMDKYDQLSLPEGLDTSGYRPTEKYSFGSLEGYMDARALLAALDKAGTDLTRKKLYSTIEAMGKFDLGVGSPAEFSPTRHQALEKVWFTVATADGWAATDDPMSFVK
jgi:ABC-type branched-subunit amino acid transport system substrate-binding protein